MNPWPFVTAAYLVAIALPATLLLWAFGSMRRWEAAAAAIKRPSPTPPRRGGGKT